MAGQIPILTVSQLNRQIKGYLENEIGTVHVEGELSNLSKPSSGHFYFTLKDNGAQIRCVFFKNRHFGPISTKLADGQKVVASGKLSLYEARGDYQLIVDQLTEAGLGELYKRFEELKTRLAAEGLFNPSRKRPIPALPKTIGIITSSNAAALQDILSTLARRFPLANVFVYHSEVQGISAPQQLIKAIGRANLDKHCDVLILARGGGSIEDLWAFNDEQLARHIANSQIPIVSGVGHETDFTIADFVADYRAETPTAAATAVTPDCAEVLGFINHSISRLELVIHRLVQSYQIRLNHLLEKISSPEKAVESYWQTLDYLERQLHFNMAKIINHKKHQIHLNTAQLHAKNPKVLVAQTQKQINQLLQSMTHYLKFKINDLKHQLTSHMSTLHAVSPLATLERGYSITIKNKKVIQSTKQIQVGDSIEVRLAQGGLICEVEEIKL